MNRTRRANISAENVYAGSMSRSFYVGEHLNEEDIKAKYEDGILKLSVPKKDVKELTQNKYIAIEG